METQCKHLWYEEYRHENADRIRTRSYCTKCGELEYGCYAFRLDNDGNAAWGTPGVWHRRTVPPVFS